MDEYVRVPFVYDADQVSDDTGLQCADASLAVQDQKDEVDINTLVRRFGLTGELPQNVSIPMESEFVQVTTFHEAMNAIRDAEEAFMQMPWDIRLRFNHDAGQFVAFASDEANRDEAIRLGLIVPPPAPAPVEPLAVRVVEGGPPPASP